MSAPLPAATTVLVVDDHLVLAQALARRLDVEPDLSVAGVTGSPSEALRLTETLRPGLALLDVCLTGEADVSGLELGRCIRQVAPGTALVFATFHQEAALVARALELGALGWVAKDRPIAHLLAVLRGALRGETWVDPALLTEVLATVFRRRDTDPLATLTTREREILQRLVNGDHRATIASALVLSSNTVRTHVQNLLAKLGTHSTLGAVAIARQAGMEPTPVERAPATDVAASPSSTG